MVETKDVKEVKKVAEVEEETKKEVKTDEEVLFPEIKVGKYTVNPWPFGILFDISPMLDRVLDTIEAKKIDIDSDFNYATMARLFTVASPEVLKIISITLDVGEEDIKKLSMEDGIKIAMVIYQQNSVILKNALASILPEEVMKEAKKEKE